MGRNDHFTGYVLNALTSKFPDGLHVGHAKKTESNLMPTSFWLEQLEGYYSWVFSKCLSVHPR